MSRILIVEDDLAIRTGLEDAFQGEGYDVTVAVDGDQAAKLVFSRHYDLVILDVMLPVRSGLEILREMRAQALSTPVLMLTARGDEADRVLGLDMGADDYVAKPFGLRELLARARALLRRGHPTGAEDPTPKTRFSIGDAEVDLEAFQVRQGSEIHPLSPKEAAMLALLKAQEGRAVPRQRFLEEVWGTEVIVSNRTIDTHILNLRNKVEADPKNPRHVVTVHGVGYRLEAPSPEAP